MNGRDGMNLTPEELEKAVRREYLQTKRRYIDEDLGSLIELQSFVKVGNLKEKYWDALQRGIEVLQDQLDEIDEEVKSHV